LRALDIQGIRRVLRAEPFEPCAIGLADGRSLPARVAATSPSEAG